MNPRQDRGRDNDMRVDADEAAAYRRLVSEFGSVVLLICRSDGTPAAQWVGKDVAAITGYTAAELEADPNLWVTIVHPADREKLRSARRCLAEGKHAREEYRIYRKDGQMRWVADTGAAAEVGPDGLVRSIRCISDVTTARSVGQWRIDFRELVEETPIGAIVRDTTGRVLYSNRAAAKIYGYASPDDMLGTRVEDTAHSDFGERFGEEIFPRLLEGPWSGEVPIRRRDGTLVYVRAAANQFRDDEGRVAAVYSLLSDVTDLKQTEAALLASQDLLTAVQDALPASIVVIDGSGTIISANERWRSSARQNGDPELLRTCEGVNYLDVCRRAYGDAVADATRALEGLTAILSGEELFFEMEYLLHPGDSRWFLLRAAPMGGERGGVVVSHIEITRRKLAEEALRESEEKHRSLVENLDAVVFRVDRNLHTLALAGHPERIVGFSAEELLKHPSLMREVVHPEDLTKLWEHLARAEALRTAQPVEIRLRDRTGQVRWTRSMLTPLFDDDGRLVYYDGVCLDITERRQAEEARRESEARYRNLVDSLDVVIFRSGPDNVPIALYGQVLEQTGYTVTEILSNEQLWKKLVHRDDIQRVKEFYRDIAATRERGSLELRVVQKCGGVRWIRAHVTPHYDQDGNTRYFDGVGLDVTESVKAREREALRTARMQALTEVSQAFVSSLDAQQILDTATHWICNTLQSPSLAITITPESHSLQRVSVCCPAHCDVQHMDIAGQCANITVKDVFGSRGIQPGVVKSIARMSPVAAMFAKCVQKTGAGRLGPAAVAPVTAGPEAVGVLVGARPRGHHFDREDLWFVTEVASRASAALANAALYSHKARIAENLQRGLIPTEPTVAGLDIATLYAPAPGEAQVGGDFFDVLTISDERVGLVVGDVSGKGLEAAVHTAEAKYMLRAFAHIDPDPLHVINRLNEALFVYLPDEMFITLVYLLIDLSRHTVTYVNAGHEVCIIRRGDDALEELSPTGQMLGVVRGIPYQARQEALRPGDTVLCYTDGITETRSNGERFGYDRLREALSEAPPGDSRAIMEHLMAGVRGFGAAKQTDDQVVVVARLLV